MEIKCQKCGSEEYYTELKANNNVARCSKCDTFIKNIPYEKPKLYVGKYKGIPIDEINDLGYLKWANEKMDKLSKSVRDGIQKAIDKLEYLGK